MTGTAGHALVVTKPGYATVRFGPLTEATAADWRDRLQRAFAHAAHPEGTTVTVEPFDPGAAHIHPDSIPGNVDDLMPVFRDDQGYTPEGCPDLHARLVMKHGWARADALWVQACQAASGEDAAAEAQDGLASDVNTARSLVETATRDVASAAHLVAQAVGNADAWDMDVPVTDSHPEDAAAHLGNALRELRAAARVLGPQD